MQTGLLAAGIALALVGVAMVGYGIPINEFSLGNTLIIAGMTAVSGGLVVIALAVAVGHLRRIADALRARPAPRPARPGEPYEPLAPGAARPVPGRSPFPPRIGPEGPPSGPPTQPGRPIEPRLAKSPSLDAPQEPAAEEKPARPIFPQRTPKAPEPTTASEPQPEAEEVPLSPVAVGPVAPPMGRVPPSIAAVFGRFREETPSAAREEAPAEAVGTDVAVKDKDAVPPELMPQELPTERPRPRLFEDLWPSRAKVAPVPIREPDAAPAAEAPAKPAIVPLRRNPEPPVEARIEPELRAPTPADDEARPTPSAPEARRVAPEPEARRSEPRRPVVAEPKSEAAASKPDPVAAKPEAVAEAPAKTEAGEPTILKSGVIDGMAYTLYTDGAIEAELPQGTLKFASINELRLHLERGH